MTEVAAELGVPRSRAQDFSNNTSNKFQFSLNAVFFLMGESSRSCFLIKKKNSVKGEKCFLQNILFSSLCN